MILHRYVSEFSDRTDTRLQYGQRELMAAVAAVGKPVVLVLFAGHTLALEQEKVQCDLMRIQSERLY